MHMSFFVHMLMLSEICGERTSDLNFVCHLIVWSIGVITLQECVVPIFRIENVFNFYPEDRGNTSLYDTHVFTLH